MLTVKDKIAKATIPVPQFFSLLTNVFIRTNIMNKYSNINAIIGNLYIENKVVFPIFILLLLVCISSNKFIEILITTMHLQENLSIRLSRKPSGYIENTNFQ